MTAVVQRRMIPVSDVAPGTPTNLPPPFIALSFFAAGGLGLLAAGVAVVLAADHVVIDPTAPGVLSAVHTVMLAFLTVTTIGALHQFLPVLAQRPLRSVGLARATACLLVPGTWTLAGGFAHGPSFLVPLGGCVTTTAIVLAVWNLSGPLSVRGGGVPLAGVRLSLAFLVITACFGVVYAFDRNAGWFPLLPHRVLAHAHLGIVGWLGLTYMSMAEKLWPMFLLSKRAVAHEGAIAVTCVPAGLIVLAPSLLFDVHPGVVTGGGLILIGVAAHLVSLVQCLRYSERDTELLHAGIVVSALFLVLGTVLGGVSALADVDPATRSRLVSAEVSALTAWLVLAVVSHAHKIVPFVASRLVRERGVLTGPTGNPLLATDLRSANGGRAVLAALALGWIVAVVGVLASSSVAVVMAGLLVSLGAAGAIGNLGTMPLRYVRRARQESRRQ